MCRNITTLRGLEPAATEESFERAVAEITVIATRLLAELPPRKSPPKHDPPLRRLTTRSSQMSR